MEERHLILAGLCVGVWVMAGFLEDGRPELRLLRMAKR